MLRTLQLAMILALGALFESERVGGVELRRFARWIEPKHDVGVWCQDRLLPHLPGP
jgi:hypothetical protein